jgi:hypothetical protein
MEEELMLTTVHRNSALAEILAGFRGSIADARMAYPEVLHLDVRDPEGDLWRFATQDANWTPRDPADLRGRSIAGAEVDWATGTLRCELSGGMTFAVIPAAQEAEDDPPNWELFTPDGQLLEFGPAMRWHLGDANELDP